MPDLFTKPPFNIDLYVAQRELLINDTSTENFFKTNYDMTPAEFQQLSPADQLKIMGVKGSYKAPVLTDAQDKAKRANRFKEDNIVNAWAKWFKLQYPQIPYTIDKVAQKRSRLGGVIHKAHAFQSGNPDILVQSARSGFIGLYIEQKTSDDIFYKDTKILKPGSENHNIWQSLYHAALREQGYWVMFSISLDASIKITQRYMESNPYKQTAFDYYCKPEDYPIFAGNKFFKPVMERP